MIIDEVSEEFCNIPCVRIKVDPKLLAVVNSRRPGHWVSK